MCFFNRYCDCFANGEFCNNCNCNNCFNNLEHETERLKAIKVRLEGDADVQAASSQGESTVKTPFNTDLPRPEPRGLQTQNWERKRGRVGPATQQRLQLQTVGLPEELLRVLRGGFQEPCPSNCLLGGGKMLGFTSAYVCSSTWKRQRSCARPSVSASAARTSRRVQRGRH